MKSILAKLGANVDLFTARLEVETSSNVHNVTKNLIETLMQLGIFYRKTWVLSLGIERWVFTPGLPLNGILQDWLGKNSLIQNSQV